MKRSQYRSHVISVVRSLLDQLEASPDHELLLSSQNKF